jgi:biopolymer transport protein ExbB/TolQ
MSDLEKFEREMATSKHKEALIDSIRDIFSLGMKEFRKTLTNLFQSPSRGKDQISSKLDRWEKTLIELRQ